MSIEASTGCSLTRRGLRLNPAKGIGGNFSAIILAVKPQTAPEIVRDVASLAGARSLVLAAKGADGASEHPKQGDPAGSSARW